MTEHDIQNKIRKKLSTMGWITFRTNVGKVKLADGRWFDTGLPKGFSDIIALKNGEIVFLEVKKLGGKASKEQLNFLKQMRKNGFKAGVVHSVEEVKSILESNKKA